MIIAETAIVDIYSKQKQIYKYQDNLSRGTMTLLAVPVLCTIFVIPLLFEQPIIITSLLVFWQESDHKISQHVGYQNRTPISNQPVFYSQASSTRIMLTSLTQK